MNSEYLLAGVEWSLAGAGGLAVIFALVTAKRGAYNLRESDEMVMLLSLGLSAFTSFMCLFYPVLNLVALLRANDLVIPTMTVLESHIKAELSAGVLPLRVTSVAVGFTTMQSLWEVLRLDPLPSTPERRRELFDYPESVETDTQSLGVARNRFAHATVNLVQSGFYELNLLLLWGIKLTGSHNTASALLAWALFYIIDDWRIMFRFSLALKGRFLVAHQRQVVLTNWLITCAGAWCAWKWSPLVVAPYLAGLWLLHRLLRHVRDGAKGSWRVPGALDWSFFDVRVDHATGHRRLV